MFFLNQNYETISFSNILLYQIIQVTKLINIYLKEIYLVPLVNILLAPAFLSAS